MLHALLITIAVAVLCPYNLRKASSAYWLQRHRGMCVRVCPHQLSVQLPLIADCLLLLH